MARYTDGRNLLDVGAGPGYLCRVAEEEGWNATGVEISAEAAGYARRIFGVTVKRLDEISDGSMDAITCHHVLEHIADPIPFLETLRSKLRPGGLLVLHVPHQQPFTFAVRDVLRKTFHKSGDMYCTLYGGIHLSGFTVDSLPLVVQRAGYKTLFVRSSGMWSMYYDPFFLMNYVRSKAGWAMIKKAARGALEKVGELGGRGDWVIGYFRKS